MNSGDMIPAARRSKGPKVAGARRRAFVLIATCALAASVPGLSAHDVPVERIVEMFVLPQGDRLTVLIRVPGGILSDAGLPRVPGGYLDLRSVDRPLRLIAASLANNLEVRQGEFTLPQPTAAAIVSSPSDTSFASHADALAHVHGAPPPTDRLIDAQQGFADVELVYSASGGHQRFSARLNAFHAPGQLVRTVAHYVLPSGHIRTISLAGPPERVSFDPAPLEVARQFVQRGLDALLDGGDHVLFLICLLVPVRNARSLARLVAGMACGQMISIPAAALQSSMPQATLILFAVVAASALTLAAVQNVVGARERWVWPLAFAFGALNGVAFGRTLSLAAPFAGAHVVAAAIAFVLVVEAGQLWIGALLWATRTWLDERGLPRTPVAVALSAWIAHSAVHRIVDRASLLEQTGAFALDRMIVLLVLGWAAAMVVVAAIEALGGSFRRTKAASAAGVR